MSEADDGEEGGRAEARNETRCHIVSYSSRTKHAIHYFTPPSLYRFTGGLMIYDTCRNQSPRWTPKAMHSPMFTQPCLVLITVFPPRSNPYQYRLLPGGHNIVIEIRTHDGPKKHFSPDEYVFRRLLKTKMYLPVDLSALCITGIYFI